MSNDEIKKFCKRIGAYKVNNEYFIGKGFEILLYKSKVQVWDRDVVNQRLIASFDKDTATLDDLKAVIATEML